MTEPTASDTTEPETGREPAVSRDPDRLRISDVGFVELMDLDHHGPDTYIGLAPRYPWGRLFGGQVVAQALRAAQMTVDRDYVVHSLHAYFIQGGTHREPVRFEVNRLRNGRSFWVRQVVARQSSGAILNLSASFQLAEEAADVQTQIQPAGLPGPEGIEEQGWGGMLERRVAIKEFGHTSLWLRLAQALPDDPQLRACALAFVSDSVPTGAVRATHPLQVPREKTREHFVGASLDHAVHFHRPVDPTNWMLADVTCHGLSGARGLSVANIFDSAGIQVASVVQEVLLRERRQESSADSGFGGKSL